VRGKAWSIAALGKNTLVQRGNELEGLIDEIAKVVQQDAVMQSAHENIASAVSGLVESK